jgi:hypothetical protein
MTSLAALIPKNAMLSGIETTTTRYPCAAMRWARGP